VYEKIGDHAGTPHFYEESNELGDFLFLLCILKILTGIALCLKDKDAKLKFMLEAMKI
jgi:hypothetical protein